MPIYPLLENSGFGPEQTKTMGEAFEDALVRLGLTDRTDPLTELVAKKVIEIGQQGERDPKRITDLTVMAFTA